MVLTGVVDKDILRLCRWESPHQNKRADRKLERMRNGRRRFCLFVELVVSFQRRRNALRLFREGFREFQINKTLTKIETYKLGS